MNTAEKGSSSGQTQASALYAGEPSPNNGQGTSWTETNSTIQALIEVQELEQLV